VRKTLVKIDELLEEYDDQKNGKLKALRDSVNERLGVLGDLDSSILNQVEDEDIEKEMEQSSALKAEIQERIVNFDLATAAISSNSGREDEEESIRSAGSVNASKKSGKSGQRTKTITQTVKLPKLVIKNFRHWKPRGIPRVLGQFRRGHSH